DLSVDDGVEQRRLWASHALGAQGPGPRGGRTLPGPDRAYPVRRPLSASAFWWDEAACRDRPRLCHRPRNPADGRAVFRARRAEPHLATGGIAADLGGGPQDRRLHHP